MKLWSEKEITLLRNNYPTKGKEYCVTLLGRGEGSIRHMAYKLKLVSKFKFNEESNYKRGGAFRGKKRPEHSEWLKKNHPLKGKTFSEKHKNNISKGLKKSIKEGRLKPPNQTGYKHTEESIKKMSIASKKMWADPTHPLNGEAHRQKVSDRSSKMMVERIKNKGSIYSRSHNGWYEINGKPYYFRSGWEVVYGRYLEFLKNNSLDAVFDWEYEPETFWFENIKRGIRSYTPDFKVYERKRDGSIRSWFVEVKGYMDSKSKTKIKRMAKYYPDIELVVVDKDVYRSIEPMKRLFPEAKEIENPNR